MMFSIPSVIRRYVRDGREWSELVDTVYKPFIARHGVNGFDPSFPGNRAAALDPQQGWNAEWSLIGNRRRYLVVSNSINAWASTWLHALRQQPGAIVVNCPEWQVASFRPEDLDLLVLLDCTSGIPQFAASMRSSAASVPIFYVLGYGEQASNAVPPAVSDRHFDSNPHIAALLGSRFLFSADGRLLRCRSARRRQAAGRSSLRGCRGGADADRFGAADPFLFPFAWRACLALRRLSPDARDRL